MPTYEYLCHDCGLKFDHFQSMSSPAISHHASCTMKGENVERLISGGTGLIFKGSGFYLTDYKNSKNSKKSNIKQDKKIEPGSYKGRKSSAPENNRSTLMDTKNA